MKLRSNWAVSTSTLNNPSTLPYPSISSAAPAFFGDHVALVIQPSRGSVGLFSARRSRLARDLGGQHCQLKKQSSKTRPYSDHGSVDFVHPSVPAFWEMKVANARRCRFQGRCEHGPKRRFVVVVSVGESHQINKHSSLRKEDHKVQKFQLLGTHFPLASI